MYAGVLGAAIALVALGVVSSGLLDSGEEGGEATNNLRAEQAPDVTLATADGQFRLSDLRGQPLLLYFSFPG